MFSLLSLHQQRSLLRGTHVRNWAVHLAAAYAVTTRTDELASRAMNKLSISSPGRALIALAIVCLGTLGTFGCGHPTSSDRSTSKIEGGMPRWVPQTAVTAASLRGLHAVSRDVVWASGTHGTVLRSINRGHTWRTAVVPGAESLDLRDIHAFDENAAVVLSAGEPGKVFRTIDGGRTWTETYSNATPGVFFDAMAFWNERDGIAFSDPIDGRLLIITTRDGGQSWQAVPRFGVPASPQGEAGFAASGTCLVVQPCGRVWIGLGGPAARVFRSTNGGRSWRATPTLIAHGSASRGVFSIAFRDALHGVAVGGDYQGPDSDTAIAATTSDGGETWQGVTVDGPTGYRSAVAYLPNAPTPTLIAVGTNGSDISIDDGRTWKRFGRIGYNSVSISPDGTAVWAAGADGRVAILEWGADSVRR